MKLVTVFGGTGFLGHRIVERLRAEGVAVRIATRHPGRTEIEAAHLTASVSWVKADIRGEMAVANAITGADSVVNAVSAYVESGDVTYKSIHEEGAANLAR